MFSRRCILLPVLLCLICISIPLSVAYSADSPGILPTSVDGQDLATSRLAEAMSDETFAWRTADSHLRIWVHFLDKGLSGSDLESALKQAKAGMSEKVLWRRGKVSTKGEPLVDARDLPVNSRYLDTIQNTGAVLKQTSRWLNAASFLVTNDQIEELKKLDFITKLDLVGRYTREPLPSSSTQAIEPASAEDKAKWTLDYGSNLGAMQQANVPPVHEMGFTGEGVLIGMLDSGFSVTHEALAHIPVLASWDFVNNDGNVDNEAGDPSDSRNHGSQTLSTVAGNKSGSLIAPAFGASVVLAKTEDVSQEVQQEEDNWVAGLEWAEAQGVDIISSSLGYIDWYTFADMDGNTAVTTIAADMAVGRGIVVINSAGNERGAFDHIGAPADGDSVIAVGAVTASGSYSSFSSPGPSYDGRIKPDVAALGSSNYVVTPGSTSGYQTASGTSFSCPLTAGVAALVLSRAPGLTPVQVRDALRNTASMADSPNNDYGWGIINAEAAVNYYGPSIIHSPLGDTENTASDYQVIASITDRIGVDEDQVWVFYRIDSGDWIQLAASTTGVGDNYQAYIPRQREGAEVEYYITAASINGIATNYPVAAPEDLISFYVGPDTSAPLIAHGPLRDQSLMLWPPVILCTVTENLGIDRVEITYSINSAAPGRPVELIAGTDGNYSVNFPLTSDEVVIGDIIEYSLTAWDLASIPNQTISGPHTFEIVDTLGLVLVIDDMVTVNKSGECTDEKYSTEKDTPDRTKLTPVAGKSSATTIDSWLTEAGYVVVVVDPSSLAGIDMTQYNVLVLSSGNNSSPVESSTVRTMLQQHVESGGKLLIEGGEVGYDSASSPGYSEFASSVLHVSSWTSDNAGDLQIIDGMETHPLLNSPHAIPATVEINYDSYGDEDALVPTPDAYRVMNLASKPSEAGVIVFDDNPAPQSAQIVFLTFNVEAVSGDYGRMLVENSMSYLLASETPPTASAAGRATLGGQSDHSGILVSAGSGNETLTDVNGQWTLANLYAGSYDISFSKSEYASAEVLVELGESQVLTGVDISLVPVMDYQFESTAAVSIPDNDSLGVTSEINVPVMAAGTIAALTVDVDITHTYVGDLSIVLRNPTGLELTLQSRSGGSTDDLIGNYPNTLEIAGPGNLDDFFGVDNGGIWSLTIVDHASSDTGVLNSWALNFQVMLVITPVELNDLPTVTQLNGNFPNPFNPQTEISFDLASSGHADLTIFDVRGRLVNHLISEQFDAGRHTVKWYGNDKSGRSVSSGVYFYRLQHKGQIQERKMLLVR